MSNARTLDAELNFHAELRVLVVDDDAFMNRLVQIRLQNRGFAIDSVKDGAAALAYIEASPPDLIFLDVAMPEVSGLQVLEEIRRRKLEIMVIMMTAFGSESVAVEAMRHGADDYLPKPFQAVDFDAVLERMVARLRLRRQNTILRKRLELEMAQAAQVQADLLPSTVPVIPGFEVAAHFRPARAVSGDFYDWDWQEDRFALTLGDVMGKEMPAALLMAMVRATLRVAGRLNSPAQALNATSDALFPDLERSGRFVTLFHAVLEPSTGHLTYTNAGHGLGFVRRAEGQIESFGVHGLPMGIWAEERYTEAATTLAPGDLMVVYSDGLLDARGDPALDQEDLTAVLDADMDAAAVVARLVALATPDGELPDDLTVMAARARP